MDCILIRHGIAVEPDRWRGQDADRPLTDKGRRRVRRAAVGLARLRLSPTHFLTSPLLRARETARLIREVLGSAVPPTVTAELSPKSKPEQLLAALKPMSVEAVVLCVGHEPLLGRFAALALFGQASGNLPLKKASAACIRFDGDMLPGRGRLRWWLQPAQLRMLGKGLKRGEPPSRRQ